jgi:magnesium transporter
MMDAFASIISNNLNVVMKFLTSVTILLNLPVIVTGFYGMNVDLPLQEYAFAWQIILAICVGLIAITAIYFTRRRWF